MKKEDRLMTITALEAAELYSKQSTFISFLKNEDKFWKFLDEIEKFYEKNGFEFESQEFVNFLKDKDELANRILDNQKQFDCLIKNFNDKEKLLSFCQNYHKRFSHKEKFVISLILFVYYEAIKGNHSFEIQPNPLLTKTSIFKTFITVHNTLKKAGIKLKKSGNKVLTY